MSDQPEREEKHVPMQHQADYEQNLENLIKMAEFVKAQYDTTMAVYIQEDTFKRWVEQSGFKQQNCFIGTYSFETILGLPIVFSQLVPPGHYYIKTTPKEYKNEYLYGSRNSEPRG